MTNNDILRRIRYTFDFGDDDMTGLFKQADVEVTRAQVSDWLKKEEDEAFVELKDVELSIFLNGLINKNRGRRDGPQQEPEARLTNNIILKKLKIALNLRNDEILKIFEAVEVTMSEHELSAFFRNPKQHQYKLFKDQYLRNFLNGIQKKYRPEAGS
ncbi:MAG: DUF1456 family protein [Bacteroidia bacterium]|nr:DUF1456 family protein [Bacteroidia bacterium]